MGEPGEPESHRSTVLLAEYADILNQGMTEKKAAIFWGKVNQLPEEEQKTIRRLCEISQRLHKGISPFGGKSL